MSSTAVIFGGPSPEHDISILTGLQAARELAAGGHDPVGLYWSKTGDWYAVDTSLEGKDFVDGVPRGAQPVYVKVGAGGGFVESKGIFPNRKTIDIAAAVICCHGGPGEDGSLQAALDLAGVAYTGPNVAGASIGMDKLAFGALMVANGLPSVPRVLLGESGDNGEIPFAGPYILKPRFGGSSIGIEIVDTSATARALLKTSPYFKAGVVVEPYLPDSYDLQAAVRRFPSPQVSAIEKPIRSSATPSGILNYSDKYIGGQGMVSAPRQLPAVVDEQVAGRIRAMALQVAELVGVRGVARIDFLADGEALYVNEINTIPGSMAKYLWIDPVISFGSLLSDMVSEALQRPSHIWTAIGADGAALRSAGSIAGKLN